MKATDIKSVKYTLFIAMAVSVLSLLFHQTAKSQTGIEAPVREFANPQELVSLSKNMTFDEAVSVLNEYSQRYAEKVIVDRTKTTGEIGVPINKVYWKVALQYIADVQGVQVIETPRLFEIQSDVVEQGSGYGEAVENNRASERPLYNFGSREVRIKAIFFEGNKRALREIGVDWSTIYNLGSRPDGLGQIIDPSSGGGGGRSGGRSLAGAGFNNEYVEINSRSAQEVTQNLFNGIVNFGEIAGSGIEVRALFKAFEANNLGKILATPEIKVLDGEEGRIQVGQDFSIKQRDFAGNVTDRFFSVGTILTVTPNIIKEGDSSFVDMEISAERSTAQPDPVSTVINKQQANSRILLLDGESTVIAGLYRTEEAKVRKGVPLLKDLPGWFFGMRYLFGYNSEDRIEQELVILMKASIEPRLSDRMSRRIKSSGELLDEQRSRFRKTGKIYEALEKTSKGSEEKDPN